MSTSLTLIDPPRETPGERATRLEREAAAAASEHTHQMLNVAQDLIDVAEAIAAGGHAYPAGIRDLARRLAADTRSKILTVKVIGR